MCTTRRHGLLFSFLVLLLLLQQQLLLPSQRNDVIPNPTRQKKKNISSLFPSRQSSYLRHTHTIRRIINGIQARRRVNDPSIITNGHGFFLHNIKRTLQRAHTQKEEECVLSTFLSFLLESNSNMPPSFVFPTQNNIGVSQLQKQNTISLFAI